MKNYKMLSKICLWVLLAIGIIVSVFFYAGGSQGSLEVAGDFLDIPRFTDWMLYWNYILVGLVCLATLGFVCYDFVKTCRSDFKKAMQQLVVVLAFIGLIALCWLLGSTAEVHIVGYEGTDNVGGMARLTDACLYLTYILIGCTIVSVIFGWCYNWLLNRK